MQRSRGGIPTPFGMKSPRGGSEGRMADSDIHQAEAELRISRVEALSRQDVLAVVTYLLAKHPDTFPAMLDDALSSVSPQPG
jgi:hypothetical protein